MQQIPRGSEAALQTTECVETAYLERALQLSVIIPTYREVENLPVLVPRLSSVLAAAGLDAEILVIDDNSQDGTEKLCADLAATYPVRLVVRTTERGLASAVVRGLAEARGDIVVVMDADLSHPPEKVPELVLALQTENTDFVVGSRYTAGGQTEDRWGWFRQLNSRVATMLAWPLTVIHDPMAGFFALRKSTYARAADRLDPVGYKIGLELIVKCGCRNIKEVPIHFSDRLHGTSKLSWKEQLNYLRHLKRLYVYRLGVLAQPAQFLLVGATGMVVDLCVFALLLLLVPGPVARGLAIWTAMTWNFGLNRRLTFAAARRRPELVQYGLFCAACLVGAVLNWSVSVYLYENVAYFAAYPLLAALLGIVSGTSFNYVLSKYVAFR